MKVSIRRGEPNDFEAIWRIFEGKNSTAGTLQIPFPSAEAWRKALSEPQNNNHLLVAVAKNRVVGHIGIHPVARARRSHAATIGMAVDDEWQGRGVGTALLKAAVELADGWLNLLRLELTVYTDNEPGVRLYKKFGFVIEGTHRAFALRDGAFVNAYAMARLHPRPPSVPKLEHKDAVPKRTPKRSRRT